MTKLVWDVGQHDVGIDRGVIYPRDAPGEVWNGLVSVQESPSENNPDPRYLDGLRYQDPRRGDDFAGTIEAFTYPDALYDHIFGRRPRPFDFSYRILTKESYKIHLVYNVLLSPSSYSYDQESVSPFSWDFTTLPVGIPLHRPTAHVIFDSKNAHPSVCTDLERILYGSEDSDARLPSPSELFSIFEPYAQVVVTDHGDGSFSIDGPDHLVRMLDSTTFEVTTPGALFRNENTYTIRSF